LSVIFFSTKKKRKESVKQKTWNWNHSKVWRITKTFAILIWFSED